MCSRYGIDQYTANWLRPYFRHEEEQAVGDVPCDSLSPEKSSIRAFRFNAVIFVYLLLKVAPFSAIWISAGRSVIGRFHVRAAHNFFTVLSRGIISFFVTATFRKNVPYFS